MSSAVPPRNDNLMRRRPTAGLSPTVDSPLSTYSPSLSPQPHFGRDLRSINIRNSPNEVPYPQSPRPFSLDASYGLTVRVEDADEPTILPTVLLVNSNKEPSRVLHSTEQLHSIPLTPRISPATLSQETSKSSIRSVIPRLPTPDFSTLRNPIRQALISPLSFFRSRSQSQETQDHSLESKNITSMASLESITDPLLRSDDRLSIQSDFSIRSQLVTNTTEKLTNKFPLSAAALRHLKSIANKDQGKSIKGFVKLPNSNDGIVSSESGNGLGLGEMSGRWTIHKCVLLLSVISVFCCGMSGLILALLTWFRAWKHADVMLISDYDIVIFITIASSIYLLTSLLGTVGTLMNSRPILAFYAMLLWPSLVSLLVIGYSSYKRAAFSLDRKMNERWSRDFNDLSRLIVQNSLHCCGYYNPLHQSIFSKRCYPRTSLPGCKGKLYRFEKENLHRCYTISFALVPLSLLNIVISLLCSNHVNRRFGKGLTPPSYRLNLKDVHTSARVLLKHLEEIAVSASATQSLSGEESRSFRNPLPFPQPVALHRDQKTNGESSGSPMQTPEKNSTEPTPGTGSRTCGVPAEYPHPEKPPPVPPKDDRT